MRRSGILLGGLALLSLLLWAPWLNAEAAQRKAAEAFTSTWSGVADGCGFGCKGCGAVGATRTAFGWRVEIEYACGLLPADLPEYHRRDTVFVTNLGTVHGIHRP